MKNHPLLLIVAKPGRMRNSLRALLNSMQGIDVIAQVDDALAALKILEQGYPALMLLDANLPYTDAKVVLQYTKSKWPQAKCVVLAANIHQKRQAKADGADEVLLKGFSANTLFSTIRILLGESVKEKEVAPL